MRFSKKRLLIPIALILLVIFYFIGKNLAFHYALRKVSKKLENYQLQLQYNYAQPTGIKGFEFKNLLIKTAQNDTVFFADSIYMNIKFRKLFVGKIGLSQIFLKDAQANIDESIFKFHKKSVDSTLTKSGFDDKIRRLFSAFFNYVPTSLIIDNFNFHYKHNRYWCSIKVPDLKIYNKNIQGYISSTDSVGASICNVHGNYDPDHDKFNFVLSGEGGKAYRIPYISQRLNTQSAFDSLQVQFNIVEDDYDEIQLAGNFEVYRITIINKKISPQTVETEKGSIDFLLKAGADYIELDSTSRILLNDFSLNVYLKYEKNGHRYVTLKVPEQEFPASDLFESFPSGLFTSIREMKVKGDLDYQLNFKLDLDEPDSLAFSSGMISKGFKIERMGDANLYLMNDTFTYIAYNPDGSSKVIKLNPASGNFARLDEISPYLQNAILTSEDGSFFYHKGFNEEALAHSISTDIKEKKFKRGGSTISMQLVKNLFLTRNKTISRKLEEIFIVWMIENLRLTSKERMYETYLNIIEWGPNIYGAKEAARFYFNKKPWELNLSESIFLASIIPSPRNFKYSFEKDGRLKSILHGYFQNVSGIMLRRQQISPSDTFNLLEDLKLAKSAKKYLETDTAKTFITEDLPDW